MGWTRKTRRATLRSRRPELEALESRQLLTVSLDPTVTPRNPASALLDTRPLPAEASISGNDGAIASGDVIGAAAVRKAYGVSGKGMTVALIDTGINYNHEALGNGFGAGHKVVAGYDFADEDGNPMGTSQHGTAVAGLLASTDPNHPGVAPGADLAALRVFNGNTQGNFANVARALQWVIDHHDAYHITAVNLSLADSNNYVHNWFENDGGIGQRITDLVTKLGNLNIPVIAATGNSFNGQEGVGFPAIIPETISVTSTDASGGTLSANAQRLGSSSGGASATDIAAPGEGLVAPVQGNAFATVEGSSFAAPEVTGAVVLLQQIYESRFGNLPTVSQVDSWLQGGSDPVNDPATGLSIGRLDIPRAASLIPNPQPQILIPPPSSPTPDPGPKGSADSGAGGPRVADPGTSHPSIPESPGPQPVVQVPAPSQPSNPPPQTPGTTDAGTTAAVFVDGQSITQLDEQTLSNRLGGMYTVVSKAIKSLSGWGDAPGSRVRVWTSSGDQAVVQDLGTSSPTGVIKSLVQVSEQGRHPFGSRAHAGRSAFVHRGRHR
jgi:subtilisin family serine protease